MNCAADKLSKK